MNHLHTGPPGRDLWAEEHHRLLAVAADGLDLDDDLRRHLAWLATWDCPTVDQTVRLLAVSRS